MQLSDYSGDATNVNPSDAPTWPGAREKKNENAFDFPFSDLRYDLHHRGHVGAICVRLQQRKGFRAR
jgi:hypothetical protein